MSISNDQVFELAAQAVNRMHGEHGGEFKFPFDMIWQYIPEEIDIPSVKRPHQAARLIKANLIEKTGGMVRASSDKRASSNTAEYRFGSALIKKAKSGEGSTTYSGNLTDMQVAMESEGYIISIAEITNFLLAMIVSPIVILSGISGTGKSLLPRKFAELTSARFKSISVQPQWSDNSDLFGYVPTLAPDSFIEGRLTESIRDALADKNSLNLILLDEMNLAPVEHYFSDFLSIAESRIRISGKIITDNLPIELPVIFNEAEDKYSGLRNLGIPHNLRIVGTANMDETTHSFSPKVLDRAFTIEFDDPDLTAFAVKSSSEKKLFKELSSIVISEANEISVFEAQAKSQDLFDDVAQLLNEIQQIFSMAGIKFGYRTRDAILLYLHHWNKLELSDVLTDNAALDLCILQKILPKVSGSGQALSDALENISTWLKEDRSEGTGVTQNFSGPFPRSLQKVERMIALLETDGATHYWGT